MRGLIVTVFGMIAINILMMIAGLAGSPALLVIPILCGVPVTMLMVGFSIGLWTQRYRIVPRAEIRSAPTRTITADARQQRQPQQTILGG